MTLPPPQSPPGAGGTLGSDILVVDDLPANLMAIEVALEPLNRRIVTANSGTEALARLLEQDFAVVLLDVQMPVMDGYETAELIRSRQRSRHLPIIFVTAFGHDDPAILRAYRLGVVDFLFKPLNPEILRAKARVFVELADAQAREREHMLEEQRNAFEAVALHRQMAQQQAANDALQAANEQLALADRRKNEFLAILGHELRNPLAPLRTSLDLVEHSPDKPISPKLLDIMNRQLGHLGRLVDDLLDVARISSGKIELRTEPLQLAHVIEGAVIASRPWIDARNHKLTVTGPDVSPVIIGDDTRLVQVISNLLNNAARYTGQGGSIEVTSGHDGDHAFVRVVDTGIGIAPELLDHVFDMFVQERVGSDGDGGLGLGLALSHQLVQLHRGTLCARSEGRGHGSTFEIRLPIAAEAAVSKPTAAKPTGPRSRRPLRAIIVDDNEDIRELTAELLASQGHHVMTATDGPSGLEMICEHRPDVALIDIGLPGFDGFVLARAFRERFPAVPTRLVAMTGYGQDAHRVRARESGFDLHVVKPASVATLLSAIASDSE